LIDENDGSELSHVMNRSEMCSNLWTLDNKK